MAILIPDTAVVLAKDGEQTFGPFVIDDAARSILITAARESWSSRLGTGKAAEVLEVFLDISLDEGKTWREAGRFGTQGGTLLNELLQVRNVSSARIGLYMNPGRWGRVRVTGLIAIQTTIRVENAITIGTPASNSGDGVSTLAVDVDAGSGSDRCLFFGMARTNGVTVSAFTYNAEDITGLTIDEETWGTAGGQEWVRLSKKIAPATGSHSLSVTFSGNCYNALGGVPMEGVHQTTAHGTAVKAAVTASPATLELTSAADEFRLDVVFCSYTGGGGGLTAGTGQTARVEIDAIGGVRGFGMSTSPGTDADDTMEWAITGSPNNAAQVAVSVKPAGADPGLGRLILSSPA